MGQGRCGAESGQQYCKAWFGLKGQTYCKSHGMCIGLRVSGRRTFVNLVDNVMSLSSGRMATMGCKGFEPDVNCICHGARPLCSKDMANSTFRYESYV